MPNALWLPDALDTGGLKRALVDGWQTRGHGEMGDVRGVMLHHTATKAPGNYPSLATVRDGRPDLKGPLAHLGLGRDGTFYVIAAGLCYHAGAGQWQGITTGNRSFIGIEAENDGVGEPWPEVQIEAAARGIAAILSRVGVDPIMCVGHKEFALPKGRKIDPAGIDMPSFRLRVAGLMNGAAPRPPIPARDARARPTLRRGATGEAVRALQAAIGVSPSGTFDAKTEAVLRAYQRAHGLVPDGICGPASFAAIDAGVPRAA